MDFRDNGPVASALTFGLPSFGTPSTNIGQMLSGQIGSNNLGQIRPNQVGWSQLRRPLFLLPRPPTPFPKGGHFRLGGVLKISMRIFSFFSFSILVFNPFFFTFFFFFIFLFSSWCRQHHPRSPPKEEESSTTQQKRERKHRKGEGETAPPEGGG